MNFAASGRLASTHGQADADLASLKKAAAELDRLLASKSVDVEELAAEFKTVRKVGASRGRKAA